MIDYVLHGGPLIWAITVMGLVALLVFLERSLQLHRARINWEDFLRGLFNVLQKDHIDEALSICDDTPGPIAHVAKTAITHRNDDVETLKSAMQSAGESEIARMRRRFVIVATTAQITPLLGLLGTILELIAGLNNITSQTPIIQRIDVFDPLMQALVVTAAGLTVSIPCFLAFNLLTLKLERIVVDMHAASSKILTTLTRGVRTAPITEEESA